MAGCAVAVLGLILAASAPPPAAPARSGPDPSAAAREADPPSAELLLYLAEFVDADGEALDPAELDKTRSEPPGGNAEAPNPPSKKQQPKRPDDPPSHQP